MKCGNSYSHNEKLTETSTWCTATANTESREGVEMFRIELPLDMGISWQARSKSPKLS